MWFFVFAGFQNVGLLIDIFTKKKDKVILYLALYTIGYYNCAWCIIFSVLSWCNVRVTRNSAEAQVDPVYLFLVIKQEIKDQKNIPSCADCMSKMISIFLLKGK